MYIIEDTKIAFIKNNDEFYHKIKLYNEKTWTFNLTKQTSFSANFTPSPPYPLFIYLHVYADMFQIIMIKCFLIIKKCQSSMILSYTLQPVSLMVYTYCVCTKLETHLKSFFLTEA